MKDPNTAWGAVVALGVLAFAAFLLYITRTGGGELSTAAVALVGPPVGAVVAHFFQSRATANGAAIGTAGVAAGVAAVSGQSATTKVGS